MSSNTCLKKKKVLQITYSSEKDAYLGSILVEENERIEMKNHFYLLLFPFFFSSIVQKYMSSTLQFGIKYPFKLPT